MGNVRLVVVLLLAGLWILLLTPFQLLGLIGVKPLARWVPVLFHRGLIWMFGIRIRMDGHVAKAKPLMIVSNHVSWLDIVVLSTIGPVSFVAKSEMAVWPLFGQLAKLQRTIFVKRQERRFCGHSKPPCLRPRVLLLSQAVKKVHTFSPSRSNIPAFTASPWVVNGGSRWLGPAILDLARIFCPL